MLLVNRPCQNSVIFSTIGVGEVAIRSIQYRTPATHARVVLVVPARRPRRAPSRPGWRRCRAPGRPPPSTSRPGEGGTPPPGSAPEAGPPQQVPDLRAGEVHRRPFDHRAWGVSPQSGLHAIDSERAGPKGLDLVRPAHRPRRARTCTRRRLTAPPREVRPAARSPSIGAQWSRHRRAASMYPQHPCANVTRCRIPRTGDPDQAGVETAAMAFLYAANDGRRVPVLRRSPIDLCHPVCSAWSLYPM